MPMANPYDQSDPIEAVKWQIFEDVKTAYPVTLDQLCERMLGDKPTDSLVAFVAGAVDGMVQKGVLLRMGGELSIPAIRPVKPKVKATPRPKRQPDPRQEVLLEKHTEAI